MIYVVFIVFAVIVIFIININNTKSKEDANKILALQDEHWERLNTSGIARMQKALDALMPDTIELLLQGETV